MPKIDFSKMTEVEYERMKDLIKGFRWVPPVSYIGGGLGVVWGMIMLQISGWASAWPGLIGGMVLLAIGMGVHAYCHDLEIQLDVYDRRYRQQRQPVSGSRRNCVKCGREIPFDANLCPYCGHDYQE